MNAVLDGFAAVYDANDENPVWFDKLKRVAASAGFAAEMQEYKANPLNFKGSVSDAAEILRVAITGSPNSPDLCTIMKILGKDRSTARLLKAKIK